MHDATGDHTKALMGINSYVTQLSWSVDLIVVYPAVGHDIGLKQHIARNRFFRTVDIVMTVYFLRIQQLFFCCCCCLSNSITPNVFMTNTVLWPQTQLGLWVVSTCPLLVNRRSVCVQVWDDTLHTLFVCFLFFFYNNVVVQIRISGMIFADL